MYNVIVNWSLFITYLTKCSVISKSSDRIRIMTDRLTDRPINQPTKGRTDILKNREEFEGGLEKRKGKEGKKKRVIKHTLKYLYEA